jgi:type I restriction enzyme S subunit
MREDIKKRIEAVRYGEAPEGYTETAAGYIPADWNSAPLSGISEVLSEQAGDREFETLSISAGIGFVNQAEKFGKELSGKQYTKYTVLRRGDFAYNKGNSKRYPQGCTYMLRERDEAAVPNVFECFRITQGHPEYYEQLFINGFMNKQLTRKINHGVRDDGLLNLTDEDFYSTVFPIPPLVEQQKIAEILATCDRAIELKQQLLEEKRRQKQWLRQRLLVPQQGWRKTTIGQIALVTTGATPDTKHSEYWSGNIRWMNSGELNLKHVYEVEGRITDVGLKKSGTKLIPINCVLIGLAGQGKTRGTAAINHVELCTNQSIAAIHPGDHFDSEYLYHYLDSKYLELRKISSGDGARGGLNLDLIEGFIVYLPDFETQRRIAAVLTVADEELLLLEQERDMWMQKKKALMQLLLTGLVRV